MDGKPSFVVIDAAPHALPGFENENIVNEGSKYEKLNSVLDDFTKEEFKSFFFLLMDYIGVDRFLQITAQEESLQKQCFFEIYEKLNDNILIELFGTLKMYNKLRMLGTCCHIFKDLQRGSFNNIDSVWKMLYALCEELTINELSNLRHRVPPNLKQQIVTAEDWFCWALQRKVFTKTDFSNLETIFSNYPGCLSIIRNFKVKSHAYEIRTPTTDVNCGVALIFNFDKFDSGFENRLWTNKDVNNLKILWSEFGFKCVCFQNLSATETMEVLHHYAQEDHSDYDAFVCCFLSHGRPNSVISSDGQEMLIPKLIADITDNCPSLVSKPKLFFIQACQGTYAKQGFGKPVNLIKTPDTPVSEGYNLRVPGVPPVACDVLIAVSSIDGYVSFRDPEKGSWFIYALYKAMMEFGNKISILEAMTKVNNQVRAFSANLGPEGPKNVQQIVNCSNTLGKTLFLKKRI